jgi:hypothetical protein
MKKALTELLFMGTIKGHVIWEKGNKYEYQTRCLDCVFIIYNGSYKSRYYKLSMRYETGEIDILNAHESEGSAKSFDLLHSLYTFAEARYIDSHPKEEAWE